jgi:arylsulfatase A-like enzyme
MRGFTRSVSGLILLCCAVLGCAGAERPNILFIFSDDQRADTIAALGNTHISTPNLDALVRRGTVFTRAYCMGAMQGAVCVPSRAMLMSGRSLFRVKENLEGQRTWPEEFAKAGYRTFISGKWHNGAKSVARAFQEGKDIFAGGMSNPYAMKTMDLSPDGNGNPDGKLSAPKAIVKHSVETFTDAGVQFLREQKPGGQPFLCYVAFNLPHDPRVAPQQYHDKYNAAKPPAPPNFLPQHPFNNGALDIRDERLAPWPRTPEIVQHHLADYYAAIEFVDAQAGRMLAALKESGCEENTIVVFSSDHGLAIGSHGLFGKQNLYDHSMHAPLIFAGPGVPAGKQSASFCYLYDIFPTLGALCGVSAPEGSEGIGLVGAMSGATPRAAIFTAYTEWQRAVRDERWKLIVYPQINKVQLFDLEHDPIEMKDLSGDAAQAQTLSRMMDLLKREQGAAGDGQALTSAKPKPAEFDFTKVKGGAGH